LEVLNKFFTLAKKKGMKKILYAIVVCIGVSTSSIAQGLGGATDPHFSMFTATPLLLNPAMTGAFTGNYRFTAIYRSQWGSVLGGETVPMYSTVSASLDFRTNKGFKQGDGFGFGLYFMDDRAGESKFTTDQVGISLAYHLSLDRHNEHFLSLGFASAIWEKSLSLVGLQFPDQNQNGTFDPQIPNGEYLVNNNIIFWDFNAGLMYTGRFGKRRMASGYIGFSLDHVNQPNISMKGDASVIMPMKYTVHGGYRFPLTKRFDLQPKAVYLRQGVSNELDMGSDVRILFEEREREGNNFKFGAQFRMVGGDNLAAWQDHRLDPESVIIDAGVEFGGFTFAAAYDINVSQLVQATNSEGAFELHVAYVGNFAKRRPATMFCPKF
jgi:type IX secretion system PorP/SprF family membrane protein